MPTDLENLNTSLSNIYQQLADMTANPKPSYSVGGRSVSWGEHFNNLLKAQESIMMMIQRLGGPFEVRSWGV